MAPIPVFLPGEFHGQGRRQKSLQARTLEGWPFPSPGDLPNPGIEPRSPALQADSLPAEPQGKPKVFVLDMSWCNMI